MQRSSWMMVLIAAGVLIACALWWSMPSSDPLKYYDGGVVQNCSVTADSKPLPEHIPSDGAITINVRFSKPRLRPNREYHGFILLRNSGGEYPKPPEMPLSLVRVREVGEPRETLMVKIGDRVVDVTPPPLPHNDPDCHYVAFLNAAKLPQGVVSTKPIELHVWIYERDDAKLLSGARNGAPGQSVLIYQKTLRILHGGG